MANVFTITITAVDKATATMRSINQAFAKMTAPITRVKDSFKSFEREAGLDKVGSGFKKIGGYVQDAFGALGKFGGGLAAVTSIGSIAGVAALVNTWSKLGFGIGVAASRIGVSTDFLQQNRIALAKYGIDAATADASLQSLGQTLQDAKFGRNQTALVTMRQVGFEPKFTKDGAKDLKADLIEIAGILQKFKGQPEVQNEIIHNLGVDGEADLLLEGPRAVEKAYNDAANSGVVLTKKQQEAAEAAHGSIVRLGQDWMALENHILGSSQALAAFNLIAAALNPDDKNARQAVANTGLLTWLSLADKIARVANPINLLAGSIGKAVINSVDWSAVIKFFAGAWDAIVKVFHDAVDRVIAEMKRMPALPGVGAAIANAVGDGGAVVGHAGDTVIKTASAIIGSIRGNNPGNIRPIDGRGFNTYRSLADGVAAMGRQLRLYQDKHHLDTIRQIITRWAPPSENPTAAYIAHVTDWSGLGADQALNLHDPKTLARLEAAMIRQEQGRQVLNTDQVLSALGVAPAPQPVGPGDQAAVPPTAANANQGADVQPAKVKVDVNVRHNGHSATARVSSSGVVDATARVESSLHPIPA